MEAKVATPPEESKRNSYKEAKEQIEQIESDLQMGIILDVSEAER